MTEKKERISIFDKLNPFRTKTQEEKRALEKEMKVLLLGIISFHCTCNNTIVNKYVNYQALQAVERLQLLNK